MTAPIPTSGKPLSWEEYEHGLFSRNESGTSLGSRIQFDRDSPQPSSQHRPNPQRNSEGNMPEQGDLHELRHRRSSIRSVTQAGGLNSLENFARSWSRAAGFPEIPTRNPSFILSSEDEEGTRRTEALAPTESRSLLGQQLRREGRASPSVVDEPSSEQHDETQGAEGLLNQAPYLSSPFAASHETGIYGSLSSRVSEPAMRHASRLYSQQQVKTSEQPDKESDPLVVRVIEQRDGRRLQIVLGRSTLPQTIFNSVNVLVGVGLLSLPFGLKFSGWLIGLAFLAFAALVTRYTAGILAKCLDVDTSLIGFADIAWRAYGTNARIATIVLFTFELVATCVALVVLFADSLNDLVPGFGVVLWKAFGGVVLIPLSFVPFRYLSISSVLGILSCLGIVTLIFIDGVLKSEPPGSLRHPVPMAGLFPQHWSGLPLSFGLLMSPWGGHSVFPNIYRDMRHPRKYTKAINITYIFTYSLDLLVAVVGFVMFGLEVREELTSNLLTTQGYPHAISVCIVVFIAVIPLTKIPLNVAPINHNVEAFFGLLPDQVPEDSRFLGMPSYTRGAFKIFTRTGTIVGIVLLAILVPSFDTVMALLGSAMAFSICIILPLAFYLRLFPEDIRKWEKIMIYFLIVVSSVMGIAGTIWVFLPRNLRERLDP